MLDLVTPVILYAILFALSTDYEVFMLSRVKEYYHQIQNNREAVAAGLESVGGMITAAGLILIVTFAAFTTGHVLTLKELGVGLAVGVLLDSTVVRAIMVPATMRLMGNWNWWMPARLKTIVPELREAPALEPVPLASIGQPEPASLAMPYAGTEGGSQTVQLVRPQARRAERRLMLGRLRPIGHSVGTDMIVLPHTRPLRIGRHPTNELQLFDPRISRFHGRIEYSQGQYFLTDVGSTNGMYLNDRWLAPHERTPLREGDMIQIGTFDGVRFGFLLSPLDYSVPIDQEGVSDAR
jgi:hypothetical protein